MQTRLRKVSDKVHCVYHNQKLHEVFSLKVKLMLEQMFLKLVSRLIESKRLYLRESVCDDIELSIRISTLLCF